MGCTVNAQGNKLSCPCHGSEFDALTGKVLRGPAASPLPSIPVTVTNGDVTAKT
jgi:cytochrome b6-f complex iron-sulfur subunit